MLVAARQNAVADLWGTCGRVCVSRLTRAGCEGAAAPVGGFARGTDCPVYFNISRGRPVMISGRVCGRRIFDARNRTKGAAGGPRRSRARAAPAAHPASPAGRVRHSPKKSLNDGQDTRANTRLVRYYYTNGYACIACTRDRCGLRREAGLTRLKLKTRRHTIQRRRSVRFMQAGGPRGARGLQMTNGNRPASGLLDLKGRKPLGIPSGAPLT